MKRTTIVSTLGTRSPLYSVLRTSVIDCLGVQDSSTNAAEERYRLSSLGSDVAVKPVFQKSATALMVSLVSTGAAASPRGASRNAATASSTDTPAFSATTCRGASIGFTSCQSA